MKAMLVLLVLTHVAAAAPEPTETIIARSWVTAMHDHDAAKAVAVVALPLAFDDASLATTDDATKAFTAEVDQRTSIFHKPRWKAAAVGFETLTAKQAAREAAQLAKVSADHRFVRVRIVEPTSSTSDRVRTYLLAEKPLHTGFAIDAIASGGEIIRN